ncbi:MAG: tRNA (adenosine(37)-N6)-threonylcarbamoyltransferase complex ATPase subunit type 1 TsaE [Candidatus Tagabacteria bacterium CG_4_10_14_0_2_um_filter_40_13]|uniref:tRNA threonylcarbamoyladenosine biosynthesis protein TsaE n=3 Tax=Candidatus Tagaibacteriota TaxID=1817918 RepID=A0A2M8G8N5_9BACT|nr:MAG: tRNA (adenosine(37)-N6)-threonylcarbamoyltransferase complex ATPase subunit type 1 TsaE [Candidatus Tagabacteria bacterium CG11_big_fil_rev_8_21_14_0_20_41_11]PIU99729.1 MAG: tRNA (adenosine(37)-N6)-threonylcarbamoyltransferase complex ATPase subunit type 1 TsaE [Candidatus Tagabacteria bacterium CG03_land_8_20_14_0_80_41_22]PIZ56142.1 MAG: tRNA (adenosine(37)-N6)-threonylcarbamoyltransferase complex ATPase subunit type 1 TsaE [Candidatus Tagabacteria bacterium CG_4_10_14_0_2_um_filter_40
MHSLTFVYSFYDIIGLMNKLFITKNAEETRKFAEDFAKKILKIKYKKAVIIGLIGELGSGKTVFAQGFARGLGIKENIVSPTFVLMRIYALRVLHYARFIHIDAYRFKKAKELSDLGFKDLARDSRNIILIEWADKVRRILPKNHIEIKFGHISDNKRKITIGRLSDCDK